MTSEITNRNPGIRKCAKRCVALASIVSTVTAFSQEQKDTSVVPPFTKHLITYQDRLVQVVLLPRRFTLTRPDRSLSGSLGFKSSRNETISLGFAVSSGKDEDPTSHWKEMATNTFLDIEKAGNVALKSRAGSVIFECKTVTLPKRNRTISWGTAVFLAKKPRFRACILNFKSAESLQAMKSELSEICKTFDVYR